MTDSKGKTMTTQNAAGQPSTSLSIEDDLAAHSADLLVFSRYLEGLPARVRIDVKDAEHGADVYAVYLNDAGGFRYKFARFIADEDGFHVKSDAFYAAIHSAFRDVAPASAYIGFRGCGRFAIAPLMQVAKLYERFGRGIFQDGKSQPSPCAEIEMKYGTTVENFRTDAPLK